MDAAQKLILFLEENHDQFIRNWRNKSVISEDDIYKEEVVRNGWQMYQLIKKAIKNPLTEDEIIKLANKTAHERVQANVNISEFVFNVNTGRSEVVKWVWDSGIPSEELQPFIDQINALFDKFSYLAVRKYTQIKEKQLEEKELYINQTHKERLTILGQMSSSFVHEFRNPLTSVIGFTRLLQNELPDHPYLEIMRHELDQLNYRISQFLHVSRKELIESKREEVNMSFLLQELVEFLYPSLLDGDVVIQLDIDPSINMVANKDELRQVFLNLIINSIDALQQMTDGSRTIQVVCVENGAFTELSITNNGPKIEEEAIHAIFEPFFTTKDLGTGIGLYICKKLIEKHDGEIYCRSNDDKTSFVIRLPNTLKSEKSS
ncbi:histidine kinase [Sutcliffiella horikoshii]|uniref:histidine kinase n=1 Tax=Sutcliffiella horikoshii TaxID=79883 RepID=A0A1Y0CJL4_9BACI|nr:histidine kinase N-terminal domain-containing protein [Sutcliffiella horikoshii]ART75461.1 histidine kinase [Sutcliffiella horikoshii]TYS55459.1 GHKL domain-containing protein [Sutcliffiella horikoshii]